MIGCAITINMTSTPIRGNLSVNNLMEAIIKFLNEQVEYTWDANGNMTSDLNKGVSEIKYNILNLPEKIIHSDGHITYITCAADGRKLNVTYKIDPSATIEPGEPFLPHGSISPLGQQVMANGLDGGRHSASYR